MYNRSATHCLTKDELVSTLEGTAGDSLKRRIEDHLLECDLCCDAVTALSDPDAWDYTERINSIDKKVRAKYSSGLILNRPAYTYYSSAAVLFVMILTYLFYFNQSTPEKLFTEYYKPYPNVIPMVRGEGIDFDIKAAMVLYNSGNYRDAIAEFDKILLFDKNNETALFYKGISYISTGDYEKAIPLLKDIQAVPGTRFNDQASWYQALTYLGMNEKENAVTILRDIILKKNYFSARAESLLEKLISDD
jgi:tetratricopeptide (TPR) repeat protein